MYVVLSWSTLAAVRCVEIAATENEEKKKNYEKKRHALEFFSFTIKTNLLYNLLQIFLPS